MLTPEQVWATLRDHGKEPATVQGLLDLYRADRECFFALAYVGVSRDAPNWARELAKLAASLRSIVHRGFEIVANGDQGQIRSGSDSVPFEKVSAREVTSFLHDLNGTDANSSAGKDFRGTEISEAEIQFKLGDRLTWEADRARVADRMNEKPLVLRLDKQDRITVTSGMPGYVVYGLLRCATKVVQAPTAVFEGIRREGIFAGRAFAGRPKLAYGNGGNAIPPPKDMVYMVYTNDENFVFDWDWVKEDPQKPGFPVDWQSRFVHLLEKKPEATLVGLDHIEPGMFDPSKAWRSSRGDCAFWYVSDDLAYAERINEDLTVFRSLKSNELTGCKLKNVERILEELAYTDEGQLLPLVELLAQSLKRQEKKRSPSIGGYKDLIKRAEDIRPRVSVLSHELHAQ